LTLHLKFSCNKNFTQHVEISESLEPAASERFSNLEDRIPNTGPVYKKYLKRPFQLGESSIPWKFQGKFFRVNFAKNGSSPNSKI